MDLASTLIDYAHVLGRCQAAWRFADPEVRDVVASALIARAWDTLLRDAGAGDVGKAHDRAVGTQGLMRANDDPRRDAFLLCLADAGAPALAAAATLLVRAAGARRRFDPDAQALIEAASEAVSATGGSAGFVQRALVPFERSSAVKTLCVTARAIDRLRTDPSFAEANGAEVRHTLPRGTFRHYVAADPGATWALNLALLLRGSPLAPTPTPAFCGRIMFRLDLDPDEIAVALVEQATTALAGIESLFEQTRRELARGREALAHLSRNSRTPEAWKLIVALGTISRSQVMRALALSRAGADIQAHALAAVGLVELKPNGGISWAKPGQDKPVIPLPTKHLQAAAADLDASMAEIERLLARSTPTVDGLRTR